MTKLFAFLATTLHEDWDLAGETPEDAVLEALREYEVDEARALVSELDTLLAKRDAADILRTRQAAYVHFENLNDEDVLMEIRGILERTIGKLHPQFAK